MRSPKNPAAELRKRAFELLRSARETEMRAAGAKGRQRFASVPLAEQYNAVLAEAVKLRLSGQLPPMAVTAIPVGGKRKGCITAPSEIADRCQQIINLLKWRPHP